MDIWLVEHGQHLNPDELSRVAVLLAIIGSVGLVYPYIIGATYTSFYARFLALGILVIIVLGAALLFTIGWVVADRAHRIVVGRYSARKPVTVKKDNGDSATDEGTELPAEVHLTSEAPPELVVEPVELVPIMVPAGIDPGPSIDLLFTLLPIKLTNTRWIEGERTELLAALIFKRNQAHDFCFIVPRTCILNEKRLQQLAVPPPDLLGVKHDTLRIFVDASLLGGKEVALPTSTPGIVIIVEKHVLLAVCKRGEALTVSLPHAPGEKISTHPLTSTGKEASSTSAMRSPVMSTPRTSHSSAPTTNTLPVVKEGKRASKDVPARKEGKYYLTPYNIAGGRPCDVCNEPMYNGQVKATSSTPSTILCVHCALKFGYKIVNWKEMAKRMELAPIEEVACAVTVSTIEELVSASGMKMLDPGLPVQDKKDHLFAAWFIPVGASPASHHVFLVPGGRLASLMAMRRVTGMNASPVKQVSGAAASSSSIVVHVDKDVPGHPWVMTSVQGVERLLDGAVQAAVMAEAGSFSLIPPLQRYG